MLTINQLADRLQVNRLTVRRWWKEGIIPKPLKLGRSIRWREQDIDNWLEARCPRIERQTTLEDLLPASHKEITA